MYGTSARAGDLINNRVRVMTTHKVSQLVQNEHRRPSTRISIYAFCEKIRRSRLGKGSMPQLFFDSKVKTLAVLIVQRNTTRV